MSTNTLPGAKASIASPAQPLAQTSAQFRLPATVTPPETVRHLLFGSPDAVKLTIQDLHRKHYAEPNDWSKLLPTGRPNEVMAILTRRVRVE